MDDEITELRAELYGMHSVVAMLISLLDKDEEVVERLRGIEGAMRRENAHAGSINIVKSLRDVWEADFPH